MAVNGFFERQGGWPLKFVPLATATTILMLLVSCTTDLPGFSEIREVYYSHSEALDVVALALEEEMNEEGQSRFFMKSEELRETVQSLSIEESVEELLNFMEDAGASLRGNKQAHGDWRIDVVLYSVGNFMAGKEAGLIHARMLPSAPENVASFESSEVDDHWYAYQMIL